MPPFRHRSNNHVLPANARAVDVAKQTIMDIMPVEQRRYQNAFEVQGYETIVYQRLWHGLPCSCQNHRGASASYLDEDGKLDTGTMDQLLSGGLVFEVNRYGARQPTRQDLRTTPSKFDDGQVMDGYEDVMDPAFDIASETLEDSYADHVTDQDVMGTNGRSTPKTLDEHSELFDGEAFLNDTKCAICFGTGFVGGYAILNGMRMVMHTQSPQITALSGTIEYNQVPHAFYTDHVDFTVPLPKGVVGIDAFRLWNNDKMVYASEMLLDDLPYSDNLLYALCDGLSHRLSLKFNELTYMTHVELQLNLSKVPALFELPRLQQGSNMSLQDATEDVSINAGPTIPYLKREDVLVESTFGKALIVNTCNPWNDKSKMVLGWDVNTRVIQPAELLYLLPRRLLTTAKTTWMIRDNKDQHRRT
jgi:hypothetical protein